MSTSILAPMQRLAHLCLSASLALVLLGSVTFSSGCDGGWETEAPTASVGANPYEDVHRLLSTGKIYTKNPARVDVSETVAIVNLMMESGIVTRPIPFADVDVELKHHTGRDKWAVDIYKPDGSLLVRVQSPDSKHANELAMTLTAIKFALTEE